jgi:hypothetical protein
MQQEGHAFSSETHSERQLGTKTKREDGDVEDESVEWEEQEPAGILSFFVVAFSKVGMALARDCSLRACS